jgi:GNAT superfamily N-acetyltransferase
MFETRVAAEADAEVIAEHRWKMFAEMGHGDEESMQAMVRNFVPWVRERLKDGRYLGWLIVEGERVVAGGGTWLMDFPPHWRDPEAQRAYLTNFYVMPEARGRGLAHRLLKTAVLDARRRGIKVVALHASTAGRPIYERNGFEGTNEMMRYLDADASC